MNWTGGRLRICIHQGAGRMEGSSKQLVLPSLWKYKASVQESPKRQREGYQRCGGAAQEEGIVWLLR